MKHIVTLTISNPAHEHVSLRRRQSTTNYMVEARDEAEAIFRASNHFKKLGNYVHSAVIAESTLNEEVEQIDEAVKVGPANHDKSTDTVWHGVHHNGEEIGTIGTHSAQHVEKHGKWGFEDSRGYGRRHGEPEMNSKEEALDALVNRHKEYTKKKTNEEVEQIDELSSGLVRRYGGKAIRASLEARAKGDTATAYKRAKGVSLASAKAFPNQYKNSPDKAKVPATNEEVEQIDELSKKTLSSYVGKAYWDQGKRMAHGAEVYGYVAGKYGRKATRGEVFKNAKEMRRDKTRDTGVQRALSKLAKEEVEQIDEISNRLMNSAENAARQRVRDAEDAHIRGTGDRAAIYKADDQENRILAARTTRYNRQERLAAKAPPKPAKPSLMQRIKNKLRSEEVEQIDELSKGTLASYITKASRQSSGLHSLGKEFDNDKYMYAKKALNAKTPKTKEKAKADMETSGRLAKTFTRKAQNRTAGISRAAVKLAKEEVQQIDEVGPQKRMTRLFNKIRDARAGDKFKRSGMPVPPAEPQHTNVAAHNKAIGRALRKEDTVNEKAPPGAKYERMVKHIKDKYSEDGTLTPKEKAIAYATAWKAKKAGK